MSVWALGDRRDAQYWVRSVVGFITTERPSCYHSSCLVSLLYALSPAPQSLRWWWWWWGDIRFCIIAAFGLVGDDEHLTTGSQTQVTDFSWVANPVSQMAISLAKVIPALSFSTIILLRSLLFIGLYLAVFVLTFAVCISIL